LERFSLCRFVLSDFGGWFGRERTDAVRKIRTIPVVTSATLAALLTHQLAKQARVLAGKIAVNRVR